MGRRKRRGGRRVGKDGRVGSFLSGRIGVVYVDSSFNELFIGFVKGSGVNKVSWHYYNAATGIGGGFNYHVVPGYLVGRGVKGKVRIAHSHYRRGESNFLHISFFPEMSVSRAASIAVRGFLGVHRVFSRKGIGGIRSEGFLKPLAEYLKRKARG